jgi:hypothetical protein
MRHWLWWIVNGLFVCAVGTGVYLHATLEVGTPKAPQAPESAPLEAELSGLTHVEPAGTAGPLWRVAYFLGHRPEPESEVEAPPAESAEVDTAEQESEPLVVDWLSFVGAITAADGAQRWYFKDSRSGRVIRPAHHEGGSHWLLEQVRDDGFILRREGVRYSVTR